VSPDGELLVSAYADGSIVMWRTAKPAPHRRIVAHAAAVNDIAFGPDSTRFASASADKTVKLWDAANGANLATLSGHTGPVSAVSFSTDGTWIFTVGGDRKLVKWDERTGRLVDWMCIDGVPTCIAIGHSVVLVGCRNSVIYVYKHRP
jgi:WD40 repeat protein